MKLLALIGFLTFTVSAQAQNIYFGAANKSAKKNEFCYYKASVPKLLATDSAPAALKSFVTIFNAQNEKALAQMESAYNKVIADKSLCNEYSTSNQQGLAFRVSNQIGAPIVSILSTSYGYTGGAHGGTGYGTLTLNTLTGDVYTDLGAFFGQSKLGALKELILQKLKERSDFDENFGWNEWSAKHAAIGQIDNFYLHDGGIVIYFGEYVVGPYSSGIIEAKLYFYELEQIGFNGSSAAQTLLQNRIY